MSAFRRLTRVAAVNAPQFVRHKTATAPGLSYTYPQSLLNVPETRVTTLANGLRVASEDNKSETATVGIWIDAGSRFETEKNNGVAHFLEHMAFKGTNKRTQHGLELEVENLGAMLNAYTSREQTVYYAKIFKKDVGQAVDILADILQNPILDPAAINRERDVILREMQEVEKQHQEVVYDHLHATAYQRFPLGRTILGPVQNIKSITRDDLLNYIQTHYTGPRMVLVGAGGVNHDQLVELADKAFGKLSNAKNGGNTEKSRFVGSEIRIRNDEMNEAHIAFAVEGVSHTNPDYFPMMVAQSIIGSWDRSLGGGKNISSRLAQNISKHNFANSFMSFNTCYSDTGLFGVYFTSSATSNLDDVIFYIQQEFTRLSQDVGDVEVERAKNQLKTSILMNLDGSTFIAEDIGRQMLSYGRRMTPYEIDARISSVTAADVRAVCTKYLYDKDPAVVGLGPIESLPDYNRMQTATSWLRI